MCCKYLVVGDDAGGRGLGQGVKGLWIMEWGGYLKIARGTANQFCVLEKPLGSGGWDIEQGGFESVKICLFFF